MQVNVEMVFIILSIISLYHFLCCLCLGLWLWVPASPLGVLLHRSIRNRANFNSQVSRLALQESRVGRSVPSNQSNLYRSLRKNTQSLARYSLSRYSFKIANSNPGPDKNFSLKLTTQDLSDAYSENQIFIKFYSWCFNRNLCSLVNFVGLVVSMSDF